MTISPACSLWATIIRAVLRAAITTVTLLFALGGCANYAPVAETKGAIDRMGGPWSSAKAALMPLPPFPWPPPDASVRVDLPRTLIPDDTSLKSLGDVNRLLVRGLSKVGYIERSYYSVPNGFAIATRLERIDDDGRPYDGNDRWVDSIAAPRVDIVDIIKRIFTAPPGRFRINVFVVTADAFTMSGKPVDPKTARYWVSSGADRLPHEYNEIALTPGTRCAVLVYEFERTPTEAEGRQSRQLGARAHLDGAGLTAALPIPWESP